MKFKKPKVFDSEIGTEIDSIEDNVGNIIFVRVDDIRDANIPSLNEVREEVINDLRTNKNKDLTKLKATEYLNKISEQAQLYVEPFNARLNA